MRPSHQQAGESDRAPAQVIRMHHVRGVYGFMYRHVGNREEAEALTERACLLASQALRTPDQFPAISLESAESLEGLLSRIARTVIDTYLRGLYPAIPPLAAGDEIEWSDPVDAESSGRVAGAAECAARILAQLSAQERAFLTYRLIDNSSLAEAAARMRITLPQALALQWAALSHAAQVASLPAHPAHPAPQAASRPASCGTGGELVGASC